MLKFVLAKMCPLVRSLSTVEPCMYPSFVSTYTMLGNFYSDIEIPIIRGSNLAKTIEISPNRGHLLSRDTALLLRCRRGNVS